MPRAATIQAHLIDDRAEKASFEGDKLRITWRAPCPCGSGKKYKRCCGK